jgi:hypothetical protein
MGFESLVSQAAEAHVEVRETVDQHNIDKQNGISTLT